MMKVLITGGAGFLGSHLTRRLLGKGHAVVVMDSFVTGSLSNLEDVRRNPRLTLVEHDVIEPYEVPGVDRVYNLACAASPPRYQRDPVHTTLSSVLGTLNALELATRESARMLQASTSEVYGDPDVHPQPESYRGSVSPVGPRACYDEGKRCAETLAIGFHQKRRTDVRIVRIFNTYGPAMDLEDGRLVSNFIAQGLRGEPLTIYGDGRQTRSLCYVDDLIDGIESMMEQSQAIGPVNLGNPDELTVLEIAKAVIRKLGGGTIAFEPLPLDDPQRRRPDIALARKLLGFCPRVSLDEGLSRTIADFELRLGRRDHPLRGGGREGRMAL
jgi:UDP-glucuronate decarboxylase